MKMYPAQMFVAEQPIDLSRASLRGLSYALRHRETWPADFKKWYYGRCETCAMGLASALWPRIGLHNYPHNMVGIFEINEDEADELFCSDYGYANRRYIAPEMVANRIDAVLARRA